MMKVTAEKITSVDDLKWACEKTMHHGSADKMTVDRMARCEHSPLRTQIYRIDIDQVKTKVSVHLVRHKIGVEHFVLSNRDDRGGAGDDEITRNTPVDHGMLINAQELIQMSRKRLCYNSHKETVATMMRIKSAVGMVEPELTPYMVPECVYRNGLCPELRMCRPGVDAVMECYAGYAGLFRADTAA
jgi:hypothetical protein